MFNKRIMFIFILLFVCAVCVSSVCASEEGEGIVSNTTGMDNIILESMDDSNIDEDAVLEASSNSKVGTFTELQNRINNAPAKSTVTLNKDYRYGSDFKSLNGIRITKAITIDGKGHTIDGSSDSPLILMNNVSNIVLRNIIFENGYSFYGGSVSAIYSNNITFENCKFIENEVTTGSVFLGGNNYSLFVNCIFDSNGADELGGAVFLSKNRYSSFVNCSFSNNGAITGGAIYSNKNYLPYFDSCTFTDNVADDASAIFSYNDDSLIFNSCFFNENYAEYDGSAYLTGSGEVKFNSCTFNNNNVSRGGGIFSNASDIYLDSCSFDENLADNGSCIFIQMSNLHAQQCFFKNSISFEIGGAIYSINSVLDISKSEFFENIALDAGGDIYSRYGMVFLDDNEFFNSSCWGFGGALCFNDDYIQILNSNFYNCSSNYDGGGAIYCLNSILYSNFSQFNGCNAYFGGAICSLNTDFTIENNVFYDNSAWYSGGSIYSIYGSIAIDNSTFMFSSSQEGGAIYIRSPHRINNITNNYFLYSSAKRGQRIYVDEYSGKIPESGNVYEDVYFAVALFNGSNRYDDEYLNYGNILTYVVSNINQYNGDLSYYIDLRNEFASYMDISSEVFENSVNVTISDDKNSGDVIFLNYGDCANRTIIYNSVNPPAELNLRQLTISIYNFGGDELTDVDIIALMSGTNDYNNYEDVEYTYSYGSYDNKQTNGFWAIPIIDDEEAILINEGDAGTSLWFSQVSHDKFNLTGINGKFIFNFEDRNLNSNFGNVYDFKNEFSKVPLINYTSNVTYLPSRYDSRDYGYVTEIQDQESGKNCWAFAGIATLEACLKKATGQNYDFSESNAKNIMAATSIYGLNIDSNAGGYDTMFMGYLASWLGPVSEDYDVYNPISSLSPVISSLFHIQDISFLPARNTSSDNDLIKSAIMNNGAVCIILDWTASNVYEGFHTVSLIGWDDNYNGIDSLGNRAKGAWIFKNSWGIDWGDEGFGYLSYDEKISEEIAPYMHAYTFIFNEGDIGYQNLYQYDFAGLSDFLCTDAQYVYYKNKFRAKNDEFLSAFSTYFEKPTDFTYSVVINGKEVVSSEKIHSSAGYHTIRLDEYLLLNKSDEFEIIIKLIGANVPVCQADELYKLTYPSNVSFISYDCNQWTDIYDLNSQYTFAYSGARINTSQVACIKAFTTACRMDFTPLSASIETPLGTVLGSSFDKYNINVGIFREIPLNQVIHIRINIPEWEEDDEFEHLVEVKIDDEVYFSKIHDGFSVLSVTFDKQGNHTLSAKLKSNYYYSDPFKFDFTVSADVSNYSVFNSFIELDSMIYNSDEDDIINLTEDFYYIDTFNKDNIVIDHSLTIEGNGHTLNALSKSGIFYIDDECTVTLKNINFVGGNYSALISYGDLIIDGCNFINNTNSYGGAIWSFGDLEISNCNFINNSADYDGGAIEAECECQIENSIFESNSAECGGAIILYDNLNIKSSVFRGNYADVAGGAIYAYYDIAVEGSKFTENSAYFGGALFSDTDTVAVLKNSDFKNNSAMYFGDCIYSMDSLDVKNSNFKSNRNVELIVFEGGNESSLCLKNNKIEMASMDAAAIWYKSENPYPSQLYLQFNNVSAIKGADVSLCRLVDDEANTFRIGDLNLTLTNKNNKSQIFYLEILYSRNLGGYILNTSDFDLGIYKISGNLNEDDVNSYVVKPATIKIVKKSVISASSFTKVYGTSKKITVTLKNDRGNAMANVYVSVKLNGKTTKLKTNAKGQATLPVSLKPGTYVAEVKFAGDDNYASSRADAKIVIKKATPKISAKKKTFKLKVKTKKYTIVLKNNLGKAMKGVKVTISIKGKTYKVKTDAKGKAIFKLKLTKKGKYKATIKYAGNKCYKAVSKKAVLEVK